MQAGGLFISSIFYFLIFSATRLILLATIIPFEIGENVQLNPIQEIIRTIINLTEIIFLYHNLKSRNNFSDNQSGYKVITIGLAWSFADSLISNLFYYLMNAMGDEFSWEYIRTAIGANLQMIEKIAMIALIQSAAKLKNENKFYIHIAIIILVKYLFNSLAYNYISQLNFDGDEWKILSSKIIITVVFGILAKKIFRNSNLTEDDIALENYYKFKKN